MSATLPDAGALRRASTSSPSRNGTGTPPSPYRSMSTTPAASTTSVLVARRAAALATRQQGGNISPTRTPAAANGLVIRSSSQPRAAANDTLDNSSPDTSSCGRESVESVLESRLTLTLPGGPDYLTSLDGIDRDHIAEEDEPEPISLVSPSRLRSPTVESPYSPWRSSPLAAARPRPLQVSPTRSPLTRTARSAVTPLPRSPMDATSSLDGVLWQTTDDVPLPAPVELVSPTLLNSHEPTLPNSVRRRPVDPDLDFLFANTGARPRAPTADITALTSFIAAKDLSPIRTTQSPEPSPLDLSPNARASALSLSAPTRGELIDEVAHSAFSDVPLDEVEAAKASAVAAQERPPIPGVPLIDLNAWSEFMLAWAKAPPDVNTHVVACLGHLAAHLAAVLLAMGYLATYNTGCFAATSLLDTRYDAALAFFYMAFMATAVNTAFFVSAVLAIADARETGPSWHAALAAADVRWEPPLMKVVFADLLLLAALVSNWHPADRSLLLALLMVLCAWAAADTLISHLLAAVFGAGPPKLDDTRVYHMSRTVATLTLAATFLAPLAMLTDRTPPMTVTSSITSAHLVALCIPPPPSSATLDPTTNPNFCNPSACTNPVGPLPPTTAYAVAPRRTVTLPPSFMCGIPRAIPLATTVDGETVLMTRAWPIAYDPLRAAPCGSTSTNVTDWSVRGPGTPRAAPGPEDRALDDLGGARVARISGPRTCTRRWIVPPVVLRVMGVLSDAEWDVPYQHYVAVVEARVADRVGRVPVACAFGVSGIEEMERRRMAGVRERLLSVGAWARAVQVGRR
ncbi:hypothetical protein AMAG_05804 [Allomyces macrogynus ATCC 38327]|uniref:Transmembrane protein n=1 Tax=Allomyces macrogynus (strain ATCC 38327) TaxID=578462 RepID=A0A0L0SCZ6_ALLM3|nr:hypothetical protein AMAG_05804 [Allomyces macrogynus ATCC 38327]|eukprot:KNE60413.1 hypothetical protein AMAG_05804 [Allomyces macrogynus ATCC 38327]